MAKIFQKRYLKLLSKALLILLSFIAFSIISMFILIAFGIIYYEDGVQLNLELFNSFMSSWYGWLIILLIQVAVTLLLSFIPGVSMAFILLLQALYDKPWQAFLLAFFGVLLSSSIMYITGRYGGYKVCKKILGEKDCEKASDLLNKGAVFFPIMMLFPIFPDDALVMISGTLKMSLKWFIPSIVIGRGIGIATIIFGLGSLPFEKFTTPWHWIIFIALCVIFIFAIFFAAYKFNKYIENKKNTKNNS